MNKSIFIKTSGNIKIHESSSNLAILMSICSSYYNQAIPSDTLFYGDVSLTGEIKRSQNVESFAVEADRLGYKYLYVARNCNIKKSLKNLKVIEVNTISELIHKLFKVKKQDNE